MLRYYITDCHHAGGELNLLAFIRRALEHGVDYLQIREKDMPTRPLLQLIRTVLSLPNPHDTRILVNDRLDLALAAGAHGVHLPANSVPPSLIKAKTRAQFVVAVSCHSVGEVLRAQEEGADLAVLGPVFFTPSKASFGAPLGLELLRKATALARIPVLALGGITEQDADSCIQAGAAGIAAVRLFQQETWPELP